VNRLTVSSALCAAALALLTGCSSDDPTGSGTAAPTASTAPASAPAAASPSGPADSELAALCKKVADAKTALNEQLKQAVTPAGQVPPADGKKLMTGLAATLTDLAAEDDGALAEALEGLAAEATKAADAADPVRAASERPFAAAGEKVDNACA
jgi:hypothetical protein